MNEASVAITGLNWPDFSSDDGVRLAFNTNERVEQLVLV
jgi:hypothetical protein